MQMTKTVKRIIGEAIKPCGFELSMHDSQVWVFKKEIGNLQQEITIALINKGNLKLYFSTNAYGQRTIYGETLVKDGEYRGTDYVGFFPFENEAELIEVLEYFNKIIFEYGFSALERISTPTTEIRPTKEMYTYLFENHENLNEQYREMFDIEADASHGEIIKVIHEYVSSTQNQPFEQVEETLIGLSAVIGTIYADISNGEWELFSENKVCVVKQGTTHPKRDSTLNTIIYAWREHPELTSEMLNNSYASMSTFIP